MAARMLISGLMLQLMWQQQCGDIPDLAIDDDRLPDSAVELFLYRRRPLVVAAPAAAP